MAITYFALIVCDTFHKECVRGVIGYLRQPRVFYRVNRQLLAASRFGLEVAVALGDVIRRNVASVDPKERAVRRDALVEVNRSAELLIRLGAELKRWCEERRISQSALAMRVGVSASHLNQIVNGRARPSYDLLRRIMTELGRKPAWKVDLMLHTDQTRHEARATTPVPRVPETGG